MAQQGLQDRRGLGQVQWVGLHVGADIGSFARPDHAGEGGVDIRYHTSELIVSDVTTLPGCLY